MMKKTNVSTKSAPANALPSDTGKYISKFEYFCILLSRAGGMFGTTLTGTLAAAFLHELYFGPVGVSADEIADILAVQTTLTTISGILSALHLYSLSQFYTSTFLKAGLYSR